MKKNEISVRFAGLTDKAEEKNSKNKEKRFYPMIQSSRNGRLSEFGMYDYFTQKYVLSDVHSNEAAESLKEIERMLESPGDASKRR